MKCSIIGASGYTGQELARLLTAHPEADLIHLGSRTYAGTPFSEFSGSSMIDLPFKDISLARAAEESDILFLALPHGIAAKQITPELLENCRVIDLSADFRLKDANLYKEWYNLTHAAPQMLPQAAYGLPEWHKEAITTAKLLANPGCYTTSSILGIAPTLVHNLAESLPIMVDGKSGVSGAGRSPKVGNLFCEVTESVKSYNVGMHRHTPEIEEQLDIITSGATNATSSTSTALPGATAKPTITFTPHVVPMQRGLQTTSFIPLKQGVTYEEVLQAYTTAYKDAPFVRILPKGVYPESRWVKGTNYCNISLTLDPRTHTLVVISILDNLIKGAAGQAVQNMNIICGLPEEMGLQQQALLP